MEVNRQLVAGVLIQGVEKMENLEVNGSFFTILSREIPLSWSEILAGICTV